MLGPLKLPIPRGDGRGFRRAASAGGGAGLSAPGIGGNVRQLIGFAGRSNRAAVDPRIKIGEPICDGAAQLLETRPCSEYARFFQEGNAYADITRRAGGLGAKGGDVLRCGHC